MEQDRPPARPPKSGTNWKWYVAGLAAAFLVGVAVGAGVGTETQDDAAVVSVPPTAATPEATPTKEPATTSTPEPTATPTSTPEPTPAPTSAPEPTPASVDEAEIRAAAFSVWYEVNGYPVSALPEVLEFVDAACESLEGGATAEEAALVILASVEPDQWETMAIILGAGVEAYCPDQSYKFTA